MTRKHSCPWCGREIPLLDSTCDYCKNDIPYIESRNLVGHNPTFSVTFRCGNCGWTDVLKFKKGDQVQQREELNIGRGVAVTITQRD
jgi:predicted RNA-binding Zn-ribbon protein involved in translation (DUF1610 family)